MEYERIDKLQTGVVSPSKLRLKLLSGNLSRRSGGGGNSSRTSPSKIADMEFAKDGLLDAAGGSFLDGGNLQETDGASATCFNVPNSVRRFVLSGQEEQSGKKGHKDLNPKGKEDAGHVKLQVGNTSAIHPARPAEECAGDYDCQQDGAGMGASVFEFHRGGERVLHNPVLGPFARPLPSKWDDAEKWIISRQRSVPSAPKNYDMLSQLNRTKNVLEKFPCAPARSLVFSKGPNGAGGTTGLASGGCSIAYPSDQKEVHEVQISLPETGVPLVKSVCMRDMGTEMTPVASQEPSRMGTPLGATTPIRSFNSSRDSTPRRGSPTTTPVKPGISDKGAANGLSEEEFRLKTRQEIVALGMKLGKMNIAAWASREDLEKACGKQEPLDGDALDRAEFEARAVAWEEAEKSKYMASFRRAEVSIQAWESQQKVKYDAKMREMEVQLERKRATTQEKMMQKLARTKQQCERKLAAAEARKSRQAAKTVQQAERIRRTGSRSSQNLLCCSMFF